MLLAILSWWSGCCTTWRTISTLKHASSPANICLYTIPLNSVCIHVKLNPCKLSKMLGLLKRCPYSISVLGVFADLVPRWPRQTPRSYKSCQDSPGWQSLFNRDSSVKCTSWNRLSTGMKLKPSNSNKRNWEIWLKAKTDSWLHCCRQCTRSVDKE